MKILLIGSKSPNKTAHFSEGLDKAFQRKSIGSVFYDPSELKGQFNADEWREYELYRKPLRTSQFKGVSDCNLIFVDQCNFTIENDTTLPMFYYHKYLQRHPNAVNPDVIYYPCEPFRHFFEKQEQQWYNYNKTTEIMYFAVDLDAFKPVPKDIEGIVGIGFRRSFESWVKAGGIADGATSDVIESEVNEFRSILKGTLITNSVLGFYDTPVSDVEYKNILSRAKATWFPVPAYQYVTRRMLEAMACKTLCVMKIQNEDHKKVLDDMGLHRGVHYVGIDKMSELATLTIHPKARNQTIEKAFGVVQSHSYDARVDQIVTTFLNLEKKQIKTVETIDLGCGQAKTPNSVGVDVVPLEGVDVVHDLNVFPYPFASESAKEIYLNDVLEHLDDPTQVLRECHRILEKGGKLYIRVVYWNHRYAHSDPQHKHCFTELYWDFFTGKKRAYYTDFKFKTYALQYIFDQKAKEKHPKASERELLEIGYFTPNVIQGMEVAFEK